MIACRSLATFALLLFCLAAAGPGVGTASAARPGEVARFRIHGICVESTLAQAAGEGVLVRFCEAGEGEGIEPALAKVLPSGRVLDTPVPESVPGPILAGPGGEIWFGANPRAFTDDPTSVDRLAPDGSVDGFPIGVPNSLRPPTVVGLAFGPEGALWVAMGENAVDAFEGRTFGGALVRIAADGTETTFPAPGEIEPQGLALGPDGNLWFTGIRGRYYAEHSRSAGVGYIDRMTPAGELDLFRTRDERSEPTGIVAAPDGELWFAEPGIRGVGTIGVDGKFGRSYKRAGGNTLAFGPEGDLWMDDGILLRLTPSGQHTFFRSKTGGGPLVVGAEGDVWSVGIGQAERVVPGAPGLDVWGIDADPGARTVHIRVACGGSPSGCKGKLELSLRRHRFAGARYAVPAESARTLTLKIPARTFTPPKGRRRQPRVTVRATVDGGPAMRRRIAVSSLLQDS